MLKKNILISVLIVGLSFPSMVFSFNLLLDDNGNNLLMASFLPLTNPISKTSDYTILPGDMYSTYYVSGTTIITLPLAVNKRQLRIVNTGTGLVTITRSGGDTIQGSASIILRYTNDSVVLESDGITTWYQF